MSIKGKISNILFFYVDLEINFKLFCKDLYYLYYCARARVHTQTHTHTHTLIITCHLNRF